MSIMSSPRRRLERAVTLSNGKPMDQYDARRTCDHPDCETQLSRYNPNRSCAKHGGWADDPTRRSRDLL